MVLIIDIALSALTNITPNYGSADALPCQVLDFQPSLITRVKTRNIYFTIMYNPRNYHCKACGKSFTASDGVIRLPSSGVECPYCGSNKTSESRGSLIKDIKSLFGRNPIVK